MKVPHQLLNKYNQALPRYTSYPPANFFETMSSEQYIQLLQLSNNDAPDNISIYIHIPFCHKICLYCGCNSMRLTGGQAIVDYVDAIKKEILMVKSHLAPHRKISQIHYGGGTPNAIPLSFIQDINNLIFENFELIPQAEVAIELHPAHLYADSIEKLASAGFNRISLGIQDFNNDVLKAVNREPSKLSIDRIIEQFKTLVPNCGINLDFIYGLPHQTPTGFAATIEKAITYSPDRIVTFSYAHVPWVKKHMQLLDKMGLPLPSEKMQMFEISYNLLLANGYTDIGMDHYAKSTDELAIALNNNQLHRNFQGYCTRRTTGQVYAFGTSGIGQLTGGYAQNTKSIETYIKSINDGHFPIEKGCKVTTNQQIIRDAINQIMCNRFLFWDDLAKLHGKTANDVKSVLDFQEEVFVLLQNDNLLKLSDKGIEVTDLGRFFIRNIAAALDPMLKTGNNVYSKSV